MLADIPRTFYIEGVKASSQVLKLYYSHPDTGPLSDKARITTVKNNIKIKNLPDQKKIEEDGVTRIEPIEFSRGASLQVNSGAEVGPLKKFYIYKPKPASRLPDSDKMTVEWPADKIELYKTEEDFINSNKLSSPLSITLSEFTSDTLTYFLNPLAFSGDIKDILIHAKYKTPDPTNIVAEDKITVTNRMTDLDIDSNNDGEVEPDNVEEDKIEYDNPMIVQVNNSDKDADGIMDHLPTGICTYKIC